MHETGMVTRFQKQRDDLLSAKPDGIPRKKTKVFGQTFNEKSSL